MDSLCLNVCSLEEEEEENEEEEEQQPKDIQEEQKEKRYILGNVHAKRVDIPS